MKKIVFILILIVPLFVYGQRTFKNGIKVGNPANVEVDSITNEVYDTVLYSGSSIIDLGPRPSKRIKPRTLFTIMFDDGNVDTYTGWLPLLDSLGVVGVSAVQTDLIGNSGNYMTWEQVIALQDSGWEILSHGASNLDWQYLTDSEIEDQCSRSLDSLTAYNITCNSIAPPLYSGYSLVGREITRKYYRSSRSGGIIGLRHDFNYPVIDQFNLCAMRGDIASEFMASRSNGVDSVIAAINQGLLDVTWGIYFLHTHNASKAVGLREIVEYLQDSSISIVTINQGLDIFEPYITSGREFNVSERGVRISKAYGEGLTIDNSFTKIGFDAGKGNDGEENVFVGRWANHQGAGKWRVDVGSQAGRGGDGNSVVNIGKQTGHNSDISEGTNIGYKANYEGTGLAPTFGGFESGYNNSGHYSTGWGHESAKNNSGTRGTFFGREAGESNSGNYAMGFGERALKNNTKHYIFEIKQENANNSPLLRGFFDDRSFISGAPASAIGDAEIPNNSVHFYLDEGNDKLMFRVRYSDGSYATGEVSLTPDP